MPHLRSALVNELGPLYRIEREVRPVGEFRVFIAQQTETGRDLVLKVLPAALSLAVDAARFEREVLLLAARLRHPNLAAPSGAGRAGPFIYHARPFIPGTTLRSWLRNNGAVPLARAVETLRAVLSGLAYAAGAGVAHGDLAPENVLLGDEGTVLADTGIAGATDRARSTASLSPARAPDDMAAVGLLASEMITGLPPRAGQEPFEQTRPLPQWLVEWMRTRWSDAGKALAALPRYTPPRLDRPQPFA